MIFRPMVCNEEEDPKLLFKGWLKAYNIAIYFGELIPQNQGPKTRNWDIQLIGDRRDNAQQAALRAPRQCLGPGVVPWLPFP